MGAVGAFLGPILFLFVLLGSVLRRNHAVVQVLRVGRVMETLQTWRPCKGIFCIRIEEESANLVGQSRLLKLPFGVAVAAATIVCFCAAHWKA